MSTIEILARAQGRREHGRATLRALTDNLTDLAVGAVAICAGAILIHLAVRDRADSKGTAQLVSIWPPEGLEHPRGARMAGLPRLGGSGR